ncbi:MAG TPA: cation diffusion facilitator family transporter [Verrucomicrobiae bacterium]|jgi:cation diffusion facilitator family transporter|nr:cation diffusion facilitator family transporter [Verrucomicrobiae bacterium]
MPTSRLKRSLRTTFLGLAVNAVLAATKMLAGIFGHSHALVADAVESLADVFSSIVVWRGVVVAEEPADEDHPYGHGKAEPLAAAVVSMMLLVAAGWIVVGAFTAITEPHPAPKPFTLVVLVAVILIKEGLFRFALHEAVSLDSSAVATDAWHHRSDAITSFAAAIGITIALLGGKGFEAADDWAAIAAACVIAWNGWRLLRPAMNELMDRSPNREVVDRIRAVAEAVPGVGRVEKCLVRQMGYQYFVEMHVEVDPRMTVLHSHGIAHQVKDNIRAQVPRVRDVLVHIEPQGQITAVKSESMK